MNKKIIFITIFITVAAIIIFSVTNSDENKIYTESTPATIQSNLLNNDRITNQRRNIVTETVAKVSPAVVSINVTEIRQVNNPFFSPFFDDPFFRQFFGDQSYKQRVQGLGSGFIISDDGYIITNDHVAGNATEVIVTVTSGKHYNAKIIGTDPVSDICLIKIDESSLPFITLGNSDDIIIGEWVIALGNPFGLFDINDKPTVTVGVISGTGLNLEPVNNRFYLNMIQTDAAINGGNSGGPLVNSIGEVIGMNTLIFTGGGGSQGSIGLGFAIPVNKIKRIVDELKKYGKIERDFYTGLSVQNIDQTIANYFKLENTKGVIITRVEKNSPADDAGLKQSDVILRVNNYRINNEQILLGTLHEFRTGQSVELTILRDNNEKKIKMKLEKRK
ncbi:MAG: 2-alkenal reductase [Chlorobiaceae bacterium]|nr:2-alkenal reductase [Chlorobiaceae bacterium]MBA4309386.1 2-alkenal reductase [Chlorobiaceae bacterium]